MTACPRRLPLCVTLLLACTLARGQAAADPPRLPFRVEVVDADDGWPVSLVELRTTGHLSYISDNAGVIAIDAPELMDREVWFTIHSHGYDIPADGFGIRGVRLTPRAGGSAQVPVHRTNIARRLGRITGAGIFGESQKLGERVDWIESGVVGCDSVQNAVHRGALFWLWGDTALFHSQLGVFHATGAVTPLRPIADFVPPVALPFRPMVDAQGRPREVARLPGDGPTWLTCMVSVPDAGGRERLVAVYAKIRTPMHVTEWGVCAWDDATERFTHAQTFWREADHAADAPSGCPEGHATRWTDEDGTHWILFGNPFPRLRCRAAFEAFMDVPSWEHLAWQETVPVDRADPPPADAGPRAAPESVRPHSGTIAWHPWRNRWVTVFMQWWGTPSAFGELWYAEADSPTGPWGPAVKVLSHDNYTFYNPRIHAEWFDADAPILIFEGTYSRAFADRPEPTARWDYNQVLYRLDLDDEALAPARGESRRAAPGTR